MAKRNKDGTFLPGVIYELRYFDVGWTPFYVGETTRPYARKVEHAYGAKNEDERLVYEMISALNKANMDWDLFPVFEYGQEGPEDYEDQFLIAAIKAGHALMNMKRGNANWAKEYAEAAENGFTSIKKYREWKEEQNSRPVVRDVLAALRPFAEQNKQQRLEKAQRANKRKISQSIRDKEHDEWLKEQNRLFEAGEIDALGNRIPKR